MIPSAFEYHRPADVKSAVGILQAQGDEARVLAGGHSLIPMMKLRMAAVTHLVDLQDIAELKAVSIAEGKVTIGAMVTQHMLIDNARLAASVPLLREAALQIADPQVRYCGTIGGNIANGDPANDMPGLMQCLDATLGLAGPNGTRNVKARDFYEGAYVTACEDDELVVSVTFDVPKGGHAYEKQKRKIGDYATAACAALIEMDGGTCRSASIAMTNLSDTPIWSRSAGAALTGTRCDTEDIASAVTAALANINPTEDNRGPVAFKMHVAGIVIKRAITRAIASA
ncbi:FAD binding domain-containing protein [Frigidibacter sp. ROC022]|uniref:FAD binding domain-containing protein n=1 Tax=Frigidibacter sp. ROC022 TaxID=2971796 RepID=UPI00215A874A|nr:xanthine dehydrogenase family protein subunit M [Frigidibacter sp. ROC022]MCR8725081.1 xanthine dehydrogenase family protein subunit M [Frigidibacter sp. ROC022]